MKTKTIFLILFAVIIAACSKDDNGPGPFVGSWQYSQVSSQPSLSVAFTLSASGSSYTGSNVIVNGNSWVVSEVLNSSGNHVKQINLARYSKQETDKDATKLEWMAFRNCVISDDRKSISADTVFYQKVADEYWFKNQSLTKK